MFERDIRGDLSYISIRYAKANNNYSKHYNGNRKESYIMYDYANNVYGCRLRSYIP